MAAHNGNSDVCVQLIDWAKTLGVANELVNMKNNLGYTPLFCACFRGYLTKGSASDANADRLRIVSHLLSAGAQSDVITPDTYMTPLHWAAYNGDELVIQELLEHNANPFIVSLMGRLPIDVAGSCRYYEVIDVFLDAFRMKNMDPNYVPKRPDGATSVIQGELVQDEAAAEEEVNKDKLVRTPTPTTGMDSKNKTGAMQFEQE